MRTLLSVLVLVLSALPTQAQEHFEPCVDAQRAGTSATVVVPLDATFLLDFVPEAGDEVAVVKEDSTCVGSARFNSTRAVIIAAGPPSIPSLADSGYAVGDTMRYAVWDSSANSETHVGPNVRYTCPPDLPLCLTDGLWAEDAVYVVDKLGTSTPIPVEVVSLSGVLRGRAVVLRWVLASETDNAAFVVEHNTDSDWKEVRRVQGAGTTQGRTSYRVRLDDLPPGPQHLRVRQVDYDGSTTVVGEARVDVPLQDAYALRGPNPNPTEGDADAALTVRQAQHVTASVFDLLGRKVGTAYDGPVQSGGTVRLTVPSLQPGVYFLRVMGETFTAHRRLVVIR